MRHAWTTIAFALGLILSLDRLSAAPPGIPVKPISLDLKSADVGQVFGLLSQITEQRFVVPRCAAERRLDVTLTGVPLALVIDVLASELHLTYHSVEEGVHFVECLDGDDPRPADVLQKRVSVDFRDAPARRVLADLARQAGLKGASYEGADADVTLAMREVSLGTVLEVLRESARLGSVRVEERRLVAEMALVLDRSHAGVAPRELNGIVKSKLEAALPRLRDCYESGHVPDGGGEVNLLVTVGPKGRVLEVATNTSLADRRECVAAALVEPGTPEDAPVAFAKFRFTMAPRPGP